MARAGCHTIQFGVESSDQQILNSIEKGIAPERVKEVFQLPQTGHSHSRTLFLGFPEKPSRPP